MLAQVQEPHRNPTGSYHASQTPKAYTIYAKRGLVIAALVTSLNCIFHKIERIESRRLTCYIIHIGVDGYPLRVA